MSHTDAIWFDYKSFCVCLNYHTISLLSALQFGGIPLIFSLLLLPSWFQCIVLLTVLLGFFTSFWLLLLIITSKILLLNVTVGFFSLSSSQRCVCLHFILHAPQWRVFLYLISYILMFRCSRNFNAHIQLKLFFSNQFVCYEIAFSPHRT